MSIDFNNTNVRLIMIVASLLLVILVVWFLFVTPYIQAESTNEILLRDVIGRFQPTATP